MTSPSTLLFLDLLSGVNEGINISQCELFSLECSPLTIVISLPSIFPSMLCDGPQQPTFSMTCFFKHPRKLNYDIFVCDTFKKHDMRVLENVSVAILTSCSASRYRGCGCCLQRPRARRIPRGHEKYLDPVLLMRCCVVASNST